MRIRYKMWLEKNNRVIYGEGRQQLLEEVAKTGSLAAAARELGMSYRAAWGRMKASEKRLGFTLVEPGPNGRRGMQLTSQARDFIQRYAELTKELDQLLSKAKKGWPEDLDQD